MVLEPNIVPHRDLVRGLCSHRNSKMNGSFCHMWLSHNLAYCPLASTKGWWLPPREVEGLGIASLAPTLNAHVAIFSLGLGCICHLHVCLRKRSTLRSLGAHHNHVFFFRGLQFEAYWWDVGVHEGVGVVTIVRGGKFMHSCII